MMRLIFAAICLLIAAGFGAIAAMPWLHQPGNAGAIPKSDVEVQEPLPGLPIDAASTDFTAVTERPQFVAVRRPPPPEAPGVPLVDPDADLLFGEYKITGVVMLGDSAIVMLRMKDGHLIRVRTGDTLATDDGDAVLTAITLNALTFSQGADTPTVPVEREGTQSE